MQVIKHLPIHGGASVPASRSPMDPINDETSGIANLDRRQPRGGGALAAVGVISFTLAVGMVIGGGIVAGLFIIFHP